MPTRAESFFEDPRIAEARRLLHDALRDHQRAIDVRGPDPALSDAYQQQLDAFAEARGAPLFYPYLASGLGRGCYVELADGSVKMDLIGGIGVHYLGHGSEMALDASIDAALHDTLMQGNLQQNADSVRFTQTLLRLAQKDGGALEHVFVTTSGAMANENALKLAFARRAPANRVLAFSGCFTGRSIALASVTDKPAYRAGLPTTLSVDYVPFYDHADPAGSTHAAVDAIREHTGRYPNQHAAMMLELVQGEHGYYPGHRDFFLALIDELKQREIAVIVDEVQSFGRLTQPFAFQHFGLSEHVDIVTIGKMLQACATLFRAEYAPPQGLISQTFTASTAAILAGQRILDLCETGDLFGNDGRIWRMAERFQHKLQALADKHPGRIAGPFGYGAMIAFTAFDGSRDKAMTLLKTMFDAGLIGFLAGADPVRIRFLPPLAVMDEADLDRAIELLETSLERVASQG